jgi:sugar-specific transcriptional regulator TrmB
LKALRKRNVSQEQVLKTLTSFGLKKADAEVYLFLAKKGAQKGLYIRNALKLTKEQLYSSLRNMKSKGIVSSTIEHPARFSALPFEKVLDLFIKTKMEETQRLQQSKEAILSNWQKLDLAETEATAKFTVIEGRNYIYTRIQQIIQGAKDRVLAIITVPSLMQANQHGILDAGLRHLLKSKVKFLFLADLPRQNANVMKSLLKETQRAKLNVEGRNPDLGLRPFPQMFIRDEEEALFFIRPRTETSTTEQDDVCLWTDCKTLVKAFTAIFEELWCTSTDMRQKITEIETGKLTPTTLVIRDPESAKKKYIETARSAKEEIIIITSSKGLSEFSKDIPELKEWTERGVYVKIMAPIINENLETAKQLSRTCAVRHIPPNYLHTTMVDGKHLFQFKTPTQERQKLEPTPHFENTFYTNDLEYIEKTKPMLNDIWKNARAPSTDTLEAILGPGKLLLTFPDAPTNRDNFRIINDDPLGKLAEKDVLDKIINAQKIPHNLESEIASRAYYSEGIAVIHPPQVFDLPDILIHARHYEKLSTFGEGDVLIVHMLVKTPKGQEYVPVAVLGDNPETQWLWKNRYETSPAGQNVRLVRKEDLQIRIHGKNFFVGWTVPIPFYPPQHILPPSCTLIEAYGDVKTAAYTVSIPFGAWGINPKYGGSQLKFEENYFNAFVTFMHPSSKYSGPGTDGFFVRDGIFTLSRSTKNDKSGNATQ